VVLARTLYEIGDYSKALNTLKQIAFKPEDVESGYALVLLVQARTIKGNTNFTSFCFDYN
jgi:hypothetical protein